MEVSLANNGLLQDDAINKRLQERLNILQQMKGQQTGGLLPGEPPISPQERTEVRDEMYNPTKGPGYNFLPVLIPDNPNSSITPILKNKYPWGANA